MNKATYRIDELAAHWSVSRKTIEREIKRGALAAFRIGVTWRVPRESVEEYQRKKKQDSVELCSTA